MHIQLPLEQHRFELCRSNYMSIFFNSKYYSAAWSLVELGMQNYK